MRANKPFFSCDSIFLIRIIVAASMAFFRLVRDPGTMRPLKGFPISPVALVWLAQGDSCRDVGYFEIRIDFSGC